MGNKYENISLQENLVTWPYDGQEILLSEGKFCNLKGKAQEIMGNMAIMQGKVLVFSVLVPEKLTFFPALVNVTNVALQFNHHHDGNTAHNEPTKEKHTHTQF